MIPGATAGGILFVDDDAAHGGDGLSWDTAVSFPARCACGCIWRGINEIHVAQGRCILDCDEDDSEGNGFRAVTFHLLNGVA